jgi:hypothetical protein
MMTVSCASQEKTRFTQDNDKLKAALTEKDTVSLLSCFIPLTGAAWCVDMEGVPPLLFQPTN